jgi:hypothetical protein
MLHSKKNIDIIYMEIVQNKFENFKNFLKSIPGVSATYIQIIEMITLDQFLKGLKERYEGKSVEELIEEVSNKANINMNSIDIETKSKFTRYITYFKQVCVI